jgi:hypothetical protein
MNVASDLAEPLIIPMNITGAFVANTTRSAASDYYRLVSDSPDYCEAKSSFIENAFGSIQFDRAR